MPQLKEINSWYYRYLHVGDFSCFLYGSINVSCKPPLLHHIHPSTYCTFPSLVATPQMHYLLFL